MNELKNIIKKQWSINKIKAKCTQFIQKVSNISEHVHLLFWSLLILMFSLVSPPRKINIQCKCKHTKFLCFSEQNITDRSKLIGMKNRVESLKKKKKKERKKERKPQAIFK